MYYNGIWNDITSDVSQNTPVKVTTGQSDVGQALRAGRIDLTLNDPNGTYRPYLPTSALYGVAGRNTPLIVADDLGTEDFEDTTFTWASQSQGTSATAWARSTTSPHSGSWCWQSGVTANSSTSDSVMVVPPGANFLTAWIRTDSQTPGDQLQVISGGTVRFTFAGPGGSWFPILIPVFNISPSANQVIFRYSKDAAGTAGADAVYVDDIRWLHSSVRGEVAEWAPDQTVDFRVSPKRGQRWTDITAYGLTDRISGWSDSIQSAMTRTVLQFSNLVGFWPGEDDSQATTLTNLAPGGSQGQFSNVTPGDTHSPGGGETSLALTANSFLAGTFNGTPTGAGWQISRALKLATTPSASTGQQTLSWITSNGYTWRVDVSNGAYTCVVLDSGGNTLATVLSSYTSIGDPTQWVTLRVKATASGGTVTVEMAWYGENTSASEGTSGTFSGTTGSLVSWYLTAGSYLAGGWLAYVYGVVTGSDDLLSTVRQSFNGYLGETAASRFVRLLQEAGLSYEFYGLPGYNSVAMGPQRPDTLSNLLLEIQATDGGVIFDRQAALGLTYRSRYNLYRQTPALALTFGVNVGNPIKPVFDRQSSWNQVTVQQRDGGVFLIQDDITAMGTQAPPAGIGVMKQALDVNVKDEILLAGIGQWSLNLGIVPDTRYPLVTVDLDANPSLETAALAIRPGDRIQVASLEPDVIDLLVIGLASTTSEATRRTITFNCAPYRQYQVGAYDDTVQRYAAQATTTNTGYSTTATSIVFSSTDINEFWSTTATPYPVRATTGEVFTVTTMGAVTGSGPWLQTATVTRSTNGVVKSLPSGTGLTVANPSRYGL
jgi:hypothetical protein